MKRLLILLILLPIILSAQGQAQHAIDANRDAAAINLQGMSSFGNDKCTRVAEIRITDNGGYPTVIVFAHRVTAADSAGISAGDMVSIAALDIIDVTVLDIAGIAPANIVDITVPDIVIIPPRDTVSIAAPDIIGIIPLNTAVTAAADIASIALPEFPLIPDRVEIRTPVAIMHLSQEGYSLLQKLEGYAPDLYNLGDGGYTIGFGFFIPYNEGYKWNKGVTWDQATDMMQQKVPAYEDQVKKYVNVPLTQNEFDALTMLAYNLGGFSKATSIINDINEQVDLEQLQADWKRFIHSKAPKVSKGLMNRRKDEIEVRRSSNYQPDRKIQIFKGKK